jgi:hypothetical protein
VRNHILTGILQALEWVSRTFPRPPGRHTAAFFEGGPAPALAATAGPARQSPPSASDPLPSRVTEQYEVLDGDAVRIVRPYVIAAQQRRERAEQRERRRAAMLATMGIDYPEPLRGAPLDLLNAPVNAQRSGDEEFKAATRRGVAALLARDDIDRLEPLRGASLAS